MSLVRRLFGVVAVAACWLNLAGCGGGPTDQPELGQVTGTVTLDGQPLSGIDVVFTPQNGRPARGKTNAEGKYDLIYIRDTRGTKTGHNRVEIAPIEEGDDDSAEPGDDSAPSPKPTAARSRKPKVPAQYNTKSILEANVQPGENVFDYKLDSK